MTLLETIRADHLQARRDRDTTKATLLGTLIGGIETKEKTFNPARPTTDAEVIAEIKKMLDGVMQTGTILALAKDRDVQRATNAQERAILEAYMPQRISDDDIRAFAAEKKATGMNMGGIMTALKTAFPGQYDGKAASDIVKQTLATP